VTFGINMMRVVHAASNGVFIIFPDVCKTPVPPAPFVPMTRAFDPLLSAIGGSEQQPLQPSSMSRSW